MLELMKKRRSIRKFTSDPVSKEDLQSLLTTVLLSPTGKNKKPVEYVVVQDKGTIEALSKCKPQGAEFLAKAPLSIVIIADCALTDTDVEDASVAAIVLQLQAEHLGLGSTWSQVRMRPTPEDPTAEPYIRNLLQIPDNYSVLCVIGIGHKAEERRAYTEADANFAKVHEEKFGMSFK